MKRNNTFLVWLIVSVLFVTNTTFASAEAWGIWHKIRRGDTIWEISRKYRVSQTSIIRANRIRSSKRLYVGKKLFIPGATANANGFWYKIQNGDTLSEIAIDHDVSVNSIVKRNKLSSADHLVVDRKIFIPRSEKISFRRPMKVPLVITSHYGYRIHPIYKKRKFHHGIDFRAKKGTRVYAARGGTIVQAGWNGGYGNSITIRHSNGYETLYGHLWIIRVKKGQKVKQGKVIGLSGNSGHSTAPHLHFEIHWNGKTIDPFGHLFR